MQLTCKLTIKLLICGKLTLCSQPLSLVTNEKYLAFLVKISNTDLLHPPEEFFKSYSVASSETQWQLVGAGGNISHRFLFLSSQSFLKSRWLWDLINISLTYLDSWSNGISQWNLAEKKANFAGCLLLYTNLYQARIKGSNCFWVSEDDSIVGYGWNNLPYSEITVKRMSKWINGGNARLGDWLFLPRLKLF